MPVATDGTGATDGLGACAAPVPDDRPPAAPMLAVGVWAVPVPMATVGITPTEAVGWLANPVPDDKPAGAFVVPPAAIPNPDWLRPGIPSAEQQEFGDALLGLHRFLLIPSVVSTRSWNLLFLAAVAAGAYAVRSQEEFTLDPRLQHP